ncbi:hypothetical protein MMC25_002458 [Agyrium rufum]|nr:hypothetical protein [Agyrium rufum]
MGISAYYDYRISHQQSHVETLVKERESTIDRLKAATKYNTTQQLLEKYGGSVPKSTTKKSKPAHQNHNNQMNNRAPLVPPPTANIPSRQNPASLPSTPNRSAPVPSPLGASPLASVNAAFSGGSQQNPQIPSPRPQSPNAEFAPNAFSGAYSFQSNSDAEPRWYDRIMDVLLGEDESHPRNRIVLICELCRLVNGQAPPGVKKLEDVGKWRCVGCGTMNGVDKESEARKIIKDVRREVAEEGGEEAGKGGATGTGRNRKKHSSSSVAGGQIDGEDGAEEMKLAADDSESDVTVYTDDGNEITEEVKAENQTHSKKAETPPPEPKMTRRRAKEKAESK